MNTVFQYTLTRFRGQIIGWGIALSLLGLLTISLYDTIAAQQEQFEQLLKNYPPEFTAFFGDMSKIATPAGYLSIEFFSLAPIILGVFAVLAGSGLLASDEENGTLDLLLAHPISRTALFAGRLLAFVATMVITLALVWLGIVLSASQTSLGIGPAALALPFVSLLAVLLLFGTLALLLSMLLPSRRLAAMTAGVALLSSYFLTALSRLDKSLETAATFSPLGYYQSGDAILGLNMAWIGGLLAVAAIFAALAWRRFERRDIRVTGEGGWGLAPLARRLRIQRQA